ncbi:GNAT family N-acetyltransferase [Sporobolomyces koalae]|uniref:GNAT family N-acetyltransferase n=1 Tax=Sporobolomyces koalae TaxID=500713 RepID=UPI0031728B95
MPPLANRPSPPSFRTSRLVFRAIEQNPEDDATIVDLFGSDAEGQFGWTEEPGIPWRSKDVEEFHKAIERATFAVVICLPKTDVPEPQDQGDSKVHSKKISGTAIGIMALHPIRHPHRRADFGIAIHRDHQGKGYAREAMEWLLDRAFVGFSLNRVQGRCAGWNERALSLYKSLGFVEEGRLRAATWCQGAFYDELQIGMLASEWIARQQAKSTA